MRGRAGLVTGIGGMFFRILLNPDITREDLAGPLDPQAIQQGEWQRKWSKFAACDLTLLDEAWKSCRKTTGRRHA
jgi:MoxR-like ATPase